MITRFHVCNYKALRDVALELTPMHVLIGPNDSGKTSILEALAAICRSLRYPINDIFLGKREGAELVWKNDASKQVLLQAWFPGTGKYFLSLSIKDKTVVLDLESLSVHHGEVLKYKRSGGTILPKSVVSTTGLADSVLLYDACDGVHMHRFDPRLLALPVALPAEARRESEYPLDYGGFGLAMCLDDLLSYHRKDFDALEAEFRQVFPYVTSIKLQRAPGYRSASEYFNSDAFHPPSPGKQIYIEFQRNFELPARQISDGMLIVLAFLAILRSPTEPPPRLLLIEEPENGVHPSRLKEIIGIVRELVDARRGTTQVVMTTHSPYVLDEFRPEEVTVCLRQPDGSIKTQRLSESAVVQQQLDVFSLGEIWTAEGDEALAKEADPQHAEKAD